MPPEKIQVSARIPKTMYDSCIQRFENMTNAINTGLELLLRWGENTNENKCNTNENNCIIGENSNEISELKMRVEEKDKQIVELEKHNSTLKGELEKAERDKEDLKQTYNNYFLQVQTLINQKAIEAPGEKKKWWKFW